MMIMEHKKGKWQMAKPDKRTKGYKMLAKMSELHTKNGHLENAVNERNKEVMRLQEIIAKLREESVARHQDAVKHVREIDMLNEMLNDQRKANHTLEIKWRDTQADFARTQHGKELAEKQLIELQAELKRREGQLEFASRCATREILIVNALIGHQDDKLFKFGEVEMNNMRPDLKTKNQAG